MNDGGSDGFFKIEDTTAQGHGVVRVGGKVTFVEGGVAGDVCTLSDIEEKGRFDLAGIGELIEPSPLRAEPDCPLFGRCGGCTLRHVSYGAEAQIKKATVAAALRRFGVPTDRVRDTLSPAPNGYRNKVTFRTVGDGVGFFAKKTNDPVSIGDAPCLCAAPGITEAARSVASALRSAGIAAETVTVRASTDGKVAAVFETDGGPVGDTASLSRGIDGVDALGVKVGGGITPIYGDTAIGCRIFGLDLTVSFDSFFQVNYEGAKLLFTKISEYAEEEPFSLCADLFCGTGVWGLALARRFPGARFYGVDLNERSIRDAEENARKNGLSNIRFFAGDASMKTDAGAPDVVILDPPRAGCTGGMRRALCDLSPGRIIYVSCNPFTLARDIAELEKNGYELSEATPVNMFPRTEHVETVVRLSRQ